MESARCRAFLESAERGSFKAAAEAMGYTPSAISQLVAALEKDLKLNLLIRSKKGVKPTTEGMRLLPIVRSYLAREKEMYELAEEMQGLSVGNLTIAAYPSVATTWLPGLVRNFQADYPHIEFSIMEGVRQEIFQHLDQHEADMGFLAYAEPMDYEWIPLADEEMIAALKASCAWDFVSAMPGGLQSDIYEGGKGLSEGQAQRVSIARAILRGAPILLMDEATSALDVETECKVLRSILKRSDRQTIIITTHRPTVLFMCDRVYRVVDGKIIRLGQEEIDTITRNF